MLRITREFRGEVEVLRLEGSLRGDWVAEAREALRGAPTDTPPVLDLGDVTFADDAGVRLLRDAIAEGARIERCSGYLAAVLGLERL